MISSQPFLIPFLSDITGIDYSDTRRVHVPIGMVGNLQREFEPYGVLLYNGETLKAEFYSEDHENWYRLKYA